jgi:hypothetical protein
MLVRGTKDKEHAMAEALNHSITFAGIDIGKNSFHVVGLDGRGAIVLRQKWSRGQLARWDSTFLSSSAKTMSWSMGIRGWKPLNCLAFHPCRAFA